MSQPLLGGPVLLKQGYMRERGTIGWTRYYYRLLQDSLFSFNTHDSKTPKNEVELYCARTKDCSWDLKKANCIEILTESGKKYVFECENCDEHRQWFDALYYATNVGKIAEYCSPLSGGWLHFLDKGEWNRLWFLIKDSFLMCYKSREDATPVGKSGKPLRRLFVIPLIGAVIAYYKSTMPFSFSIQLITAGEVKTEFIFSAARPDFPDSPSIFALPPSWIDGCGPYCLSCSEPIMNVWMEVLYVSTGKMLPGDVVEKETALELDLGLDGLKAESTPTPSVTHRIHALGKGVDVDKSNKDEIKARASAVQPEYVSHGVHIPMKESDDSGNETDRKDGNVMNGASFVKNPDVSIPPLSSIFSTNQNVTKDPRKSEGCMQQ